MIHCPKCGFEQPPDTYCAHCGVNMETFRVPTPPLARRLAGSGAFLGFLIGVVIFATTYLIYNHRKSNLLAQNETIAAISKVAEQMTAKTEVPQSAPQVENSDYPENNTEDIENTPILSTTTTTMLMPSTTLPQATAGAAIRATRKQTLTVQFVEVPLAAFQVLFAGLNEAGQSGVIPEFSTRIAQLAANKANDDIRVLKGSKESTSTGTLKLSQTLIGGQGRGLNITINTRANGESLAIDINIENKGMMSGNFGSDLSIQNFQGSFDLPVKSAAYFADVISKPTGLSPEMESDLAKDPVFRILNSTSFQQRQSSFFIFIENSGEVAGEETP